MFVAHDTLQVIACVTLVSLVMSTENGLLDTQQASPVLDVAVDSVGKHLATAHESGVVCVFESVPVKAVGEAPPATDDSSREPDAEWRLIAVVPRNASTAEEEDSSAPLTPSPTGPRGAALSVAWAPSVFYPLAFAVCTEGDHQVTIWNDATGEYRFENVYSHTLPSAGLTVAWAPCQYGKLFAVGCADGSLVFFTGHPDMTWEVQTVSASQSRCCSISFAPFFPPGVLLMAPLESEVPLDATPPPVPVPPPRLVSCDGTAELRVWTHSFGSAAADGGGVPTSVWTPSSLLYALPHSEVTPHWSSVAWAPNVGLPFAYIAAGSEEGVVGVWRQDGQPSPAWQCAVLPTASDCVTKLSWSQVGSFLSVSTADGTVSLWKETPSGEWELASELQNPLQEQV